LNLNAHTSIFASFLRVICFFAIFAHPFLHFHFLAFSARDDAAKEKIEGVHKAMGRK
jgi:hypothetical protein